MGHLGEECIAQEELECATGKVTKPARKSQARAKIEILTS